ncbi:MAG: tetratricopeptide repeat protein [Nitrospirota bacterium]
MKRMAIGLLIVFLFSFGCQKKEEQKTSQQGFSGPVQSPGQLQNQIQLLQDAVKKNPQDVRGWIQLGNVLMDTARFQEAIDAYQRALELDPRNVDVRVDMGTCYRNMGQPQKAVEEYKKAISIDPNHVNAHRNLGVVFAFDLREKKLAVKEFEEYLRLAPNAPDATQVRQIIADLKTS